MNRSLVALALFSGCGLAPTSMTPPNSTSPTSMTVRFDAVVGSEPFRCDRTFTLGTTGSTYTPKDLRMYVSEVRLISSEGDEVPLSLTPDDTFQNNSVAMLDFEDATGSCEGTAATHRAVLGTAPAGDFHGLAFTLGVPFAENHHDATAAAAPLASSALFWSWQAGYKFLKADGATTGLPGGHFVHLGSTGCQPGTEPNSISACASPNRARVRLEHFHPDDDTVVFDLGALLAGSNLDTNMAMSAPGCMSGATDVDCAPIFDRLGLPFGGSVANPQTVFTAK